ncbi:MAG: hypothetical protein QM730_04095 [Anaerolineales bacterium]
MFTIPFRRFSINSRLTPENLKKRLIEIVLAPPSPILLLWQVPAGKLYSGSLSSNSFRLKRLWGHTPKNLWIPTFRGNIYPTPDGSVIVVTISLEGFDAVAIIAYHLFFLLGLFIGLRVGFELFVFILLIFALADGSGYYLGFVKGERFFVSDFNTILSKD